MMHSRRPKWPDVDDYRRQDHTELSIFWESKTRSAGILKENPRDPAILQQAVTA